MITLIVRRDTSPKEIQLTQNSLMKELWQINGAEMLTVDDWRDGLKQVRTPFVCLVEGDCTLSPKYLSNIMSIITTDGHSPTKGTGGYLKLAMIAPAVGVDNYRNRILGYRVEGQEVYPSRDGSSDQIGFVPGAILRYSSFKKDLDQLPWEEKNLVKLSAAISAYLWNTNRRLMTHSDVTYVSTHAHLETPCLIDLPDKVKEIFEREKL